jgi:hypothetical protein
LWKISPKSAVSGYGSRVILEAWSGSEDLIDQIKLLGAQLTHTCFHEKAKRLAIRLPPDILHPTTVALPLAADEKHRPWTARIDSRHRTP